MKITKLHRDVAEALYTERASAEEIRARFRLSAKTVARWQAEPAFQAVLKEVEARHRRRARWLLVTFAEIAAARLVKLTEAESLETARKACLDVLAQAEINAEAVQPGDTLAVDLEAIDADTRRRIYELLAAQPERAPKPEPPADAEPVAGTPATADTEGRALPARRAPGPPPRPSITEPATVLRRIAAAARGAQGARDCP